MAKYHSLLGLLFAQAAKALVRQVGMEMNDVAVIGSHGLAIGLFFPLSTRVVIFPLLFSSRQTVYHQPEPVLLFDHCVTSTLQLGDPSVIAHHCKVQTVGDFRVADMAAGGQGAPLVPYLDVVLSRRHLLQSKRITVLVNIGGISNISACSPNGQT